MFMIVRHYTGPTTFSHEERSGPFSTLNEFDEAAYPHRDIFLSDVYIEGEDNVRRRYFYSEGMERRRVERERQKQESNRGQ